MSDIFQQHSALLDADGRVAVDAPCLQCGYNLRSLEATAACPECRALVITSLQQGLMRFAPTQWTRRIARGLQLVLISMGVMLFGMVVMMLFGIALAISMRTSGSMGEAIFGMIAFYTAGLAGLITGIVGMVFSTTREPVVTGKPMERDARWLVRRCLWGLLILFVIYIALSINLAIAGAFDASRMSSPFAVFGIGSTDPLQILFGICILMQAIVGGIVLPAAFLRHVGTLLRRTPRKGLVTFARIEFWLFLFSAITMTAGYAGFFAVSAGTFMPVPVPAATTAPSAAGAILTKMTYNASNGTWTMTQTTSMPSGPPMVVTTTMPVGAPMFGKPPTSAPVAYMVNPTRPSAAFMIMSAVTGLAACISMPVSIAAIILLFMAYRAIRDEARIPGPA